MAGSNTLVQDLSLPCSREQRQLVTLGMQVTHKDSMAAINELTGAAVTTKGRYYKSGTPLPEGEQRLFLLIEGPTELSVKKAKDEIKRILEETTEKVFRRDGPSTGRYSIM